MASGLFLVPCSLFLATSYQQLATCTPAVHCHPGSVSRQFNIAAAGNRHFPARYVRLLGVVKGK